MIPFLKCKILRIPAVNPMLILEKVSPYKLYWIVQILFQKKKKKDSLMQKILIMILIFWEKQKTNYC